MYKSYQVHTIAERILARLVPTDREDGILDWIERELDVIYNEGYVDGVNDAKEHRKF